MAAANQRPSPSNPAAVKIGGSWQHDGIKRTPEKTNALGGRGRILPNYREKASVPYCGQGVALTAVADRARLLRFARQVITIEMIGHAAPKRSGCSRRLCSSIRRRCSAVSSIRRSDPGGSGTPADSASPAPVVANGRPGGLVRPRCQPHGRRGHRDGGFCQGQPGGGFSAGGRHHGPWHGSSQGDGRTFHDRLQIFAWWEAGAAQEPLAVRATALDTLVRARTRAGAGAQAWRRPPDGSGRRRRAGRGAARRGSDSDAGLPLRPVVGCVTVTLPECAVNGPHTRADDVPAPDGERPQGPGARGR